MSEIRDKVEQGIVPIKAELVWFFILILAIVGGIVGMHATYKIGFRDGVQDEKTKSLEDIVFNYGIYQKLEKDAQNE